MSLRLLHDKRRMRPLTAGTSVGEIRSIRVGRSRRKNTNARAKARQELVDVQASPLLAASPLVMRLKSQYAEKSVALSRLTPTAADTLCRQPVLFASAAQPLSFDVHT